MLEVQPFQSDDDDIYAYIYIMIWYDIWFLSAIDIIYYLIFNIMYSDFSCLYGFVVISQNHSTF